MISRFFAQLGFDSMLHLVVCNQVDLTVFYAVARQLQEQQLQARQLVLQQQAASAVAAASKTQREVCYLLHSDHLDCIHWHTRPIAVYAAVSVCFCVLLQYGVAVAGVCLPLHCLCRCHSLLHCLCRCCLTSCSSCPPTCRTAPDLHMCRDQICPEKIFCPSDMTNA